MILINLLPHREEKRKRRKAAFFLGLALAAAAGLAAVGLWYLVLQQMTENQMRRNDFLTTEIRKLEVQIKDIATLRAEIDALKARQKAVEDLQIDRNLPVHVLNELVKQTPEGVYFSSIKQDGQVLLLNGIAQTNERVSELLRNTSNNSEWLTKPELVEIKAAVLQTASREQKRLFDFSMRVTIKRPQDVDAAAAAASAAMPAAAASAAVAAKKP
ncbi:MULTISPECIES: PilN domain-containing protein [unclassified Rhizobacter]|uniref:PilN domain-containing protein n=1 Tax=unclassified Rhizobacter TaxID=2640088 RepID=UPI0006FBDCED|nr:MULTISPECIES: PilN domain-containing protein [unclassified Rhizobacter]KQU67030.1 fimbrial assembly protein [Rhizobacter sp. Root29]KQV98259.1 fimbrial assembly protein [Rhizobacter sp. Root1238]KRB02157.1 fimbrial assembly protein [Rhizobacter sp. Root16D2]